MAKKAIFDTKNILVAGGAGFIGSHLCDILIEKYKVICVDDFSSGQEKNIDHLLSNPNFVFINHDLSVPLDLENIEELKNFRIKFQGIQEIYNLACPMSPKNFMQNRLKLLSANSLVLKNLLDLAVKHESKILHVSSSVVYGLRESRETKELIKENDIGTVNILSDRSAYDEGKRFAETMVYNYKKVHNLDARVIRLFRTYGPRMKLNDDQMIPDFIKNALDNEPITIFGDEQTSSSFCYVNDAVDAMILVMDSKISEPVNVGSDIDVNFTDLAKKVIEKTDSKSNIVYGEKKLFMNQLLLPDIYNIRNELGWMPVVTLDQGLEKTIFDLRASKRLKGIS